jgi:hypothetical protein
MPRQYVRHPKRVTRRGLKFTDTKFVRAAKNAVGTQFDIIQRVGNAIIGGNFLGNARGEYAIDIQPSRDADEDGNTEVASGNSAIAIGNALQSSGNSAIALGLGTRATGNSSISIGVGGSADGNNSIALAGASVTAERGIGIGHGAQVRIPNTINIAGAPIIQFASGGVPAANWLRQFSGNEFFIYSDLISLYTVADYEFALPTRTRFWLHDFGIVLLYNIPTVQPYIRFGITGDPTKFLTSTQTTRLDAVGRSEIYFPRSGIADESCSTLLAGVTVAATAALAPSARFFWRGVLVEAD